MNKYMRSRHKQRGWAGWAALAGAAIGAVSNKSKGGGQVTGTQQQDIPPSLQPFLTGEGGLLPTAQNWFTSGRFPQYPPFSTVPGQSPETLQAQGLTTQRALAGNPLLPAAQGSLFGTLTGQNLYSNPAMPLLAGTAGGQFLGSNPFLDDMFRAAASGVSTEFSQSIAPGLASGLSLAGRMSRGGDPNAATESIFGRARGQLGDTLNRLAAGIYGPAYSLERQLQQGAATDLGRFFGQERAFQESAIPRAPGLAQQDYFDIGQLGGVGAQRDVQLARLLEDQLARFRYNEPTAQELQRFDIYGNLIRGVPLGGSGQQFQPSYPGSPLLGALGGAALGGALYNAWPGNQQDQGMVGYIPSGGTMGYLDPNAQQY